MKKKLLYINIMCFVIALAFVIGGVFAASQLKYSISGAIKFESNDCWVNIEGQVEGSANEVDDYQYFAKGQGSAKTWETGDIDFDRSQNNTITIPLTFENYSYYKVKATISGLPASNDNFETDISETTLYMLEYADGGVADAETATITLTLKDGVESATFPLSLNVVFQKVDTIDASPYFTYTTSGTSATITGLSSQGASRTAIEIPEKMGTYTVTAIGANAFASKTNLKRVKISDTVKNIGVSAFEGCTNLEQINIPSALTTFSSKAFKDCTKIKQANLPNSVTSVGTSAFEGCKNLQTVHLPIGLTEVKDRTFYGCTNLEAINYPASITQIGAGAFAYCSTLSTVTIPTGVTTIGAEAFRSCVNLSELNYNATSCADFNFSSQAFTNAGTAHSGITMNIANNVRKIPAFMFAEYFGLKPDSVLEGIMIGANVSAVNFASGSNCTSIGTYSFGGSKNLTQFVIPDSVTTIGSRAFYSSGLTSIVIPENITSLGTQIFMDCKSLANVEYRAINCADLTDGAFHALGSGVDTFVNMSVTIANTVERIPNYLFEGLAFLTNLEIEGNTLESIGNYAFSSTKITSLTLPNSLKTIGNNSFSSCTALAGEVVIPEGTTTLGSSTFSSCSAITSLTIPTTVASIGNYAFSGTRALTTLNYNAISCANFASGNHIFDYAGQNGVGITLTIGSSVQSIPAYLFYPYSTTSYAPKFNCGVTMPNSVTSIGANAFYNCSTLKSLTLGASVTTIGTSAFCNCSGITGSVVIPEGTTTIGSSAFSGCSAITSLTIPTTVTSIGNSAFSGTRALTTLNYNAKACADFATSNYVFSYAGQNGDGITLTIGSSVQSIPANLFYPYSTTSYAPKFNCGAIIPNSVTAIGNNAFRSCATLTSISLGTGLATIGDYSFYGCSGMTSGMKFNSSVTTIGTYAFSGCTQLTGQINLPSSLATLGAYAFSGCTQLAGQLNLPSGLTTLGSYAFQNCSSITGTIEIPELITEVPAGAFSGCGVEIVNIPNHVTKIGVRAFANCSAMKTLTIGEGVTTLETYCFYYTTGLTTINFNAISANLTTTSYNYVFSCSGNSDSGIVLTFGDKVTRITDELFCPENYRVNRPNIRIITIGESVTYIGECVFFANNNLEQINFNAIACADFDDNTRTFEDCGTSCGGSQITIGPKVTRIPAYLFCPRVGLDDSVFGETIVIPDSVVEIGDYAFYQCGGVKSIVVGSGVKSIGIYGIYTSCSVTLSVTTGWYVTKTKGASSGTTLSSNSLSNPSTVRNYFYSKYDDYYWYRT